MFWDADALVFCKLKSDLPPPDFVGGCAGGLLQQTDEFGERTLALPLVCAIEPLSINLAWAEITSAYAMTAWFYSAVHFWGTFQRGSLVINIDWG